MPNDRPRRPSTSRGAGAPRSGGASRSGSAPRSGGASRSGGAPRSGGGARSAAPRAGGARSGAPRDGERRTSFTKYGERPSGPRTGGPRREGDAPRGRSGPRRDGDAPRDRKPYGERSERKPYGERSERKPYGERPSGPRTGGPRREGDAPRGPRERGERKPYGERSERKPYGDRPSGPRTGGPRREGTGPRREGDAPRGRSGPRTGGPRRDGDAPRDRKPYGDRSERKPYGDRSERKPYGERPSGPRTGGPRREGDAPRGRSGPRRDDRSREVREEIVERPLTAAEKKAREVRARTGGRRTEGHGEPTTPPKRERIEWVDEGAVRGTARRAVKRGGGGESAPARIQGIPRADRPLPGTVSREVERGVGARQSKSTSERLQKAIDAFERERYAEASKLLVALSRQLPGMALVHELAGLCAYRQSKWRTVVNELEAVRVLDVSRTSVLPVLADAYRALHRWAKVNDLWQELKGLSPHPAVLAEGRIVVAGALADQGKMAEAIELFKSVLAVPKRVQEYHLREWYVVADLNDRVGNVTDARRMFDRVAKYDRAFADVEDRLAQLGAPR